MFYDWALAQRGYGIVVVQTDGTVIVLEYNELLGRIAQGTVGAEDSIVSRVFTEGKRRKVGSLRVYGMVRSGEVKTEDLPRRVPDGVLATGAEARSLLHAIEGTEVPLTPEMETLLRAVSSPPAGELLRAVTAALATVPTAELPRPASAPNPRLDGPKSTEH